MKLTEIAIAVAAAGLGIGSGIWLMQHSHTAVKPVPQSGPEVAVHHKETRLPFCPPFCFDSVAGVHVKKEL
jgi:hypothetical protein